MTTDELVHEVTSAYQRLAGAAARLRYLADHYVEITLAEGQRPDEEQDVRGRLAELTRVLPWGLAAWDDPAWQTYEPSPSAPASTCLRVGQLALVDTQALPPLPALVRFIGHGHLFLTSKKKLAYASRELIQTLTLRLALASAPGSVRLHLADPAHSGSSLASLLRLPDTLRGTKVLTQSDELERELSLLVAHVDEIVQTRLLNLYPSLEAYNVSTTGIAVPYHVLVLADFPAGCSPRAVDLLFHLARNGPRAGVYLIASLNPDLPLPRETSLDDLTALGTTLRFSAPDQLSWDDPDFHDYTIVPDPLPAAEHTNIWLSQVGERAQQVSMDLPFDRIAIPSAERWTGSSIERLRVPIGVDTKGELHHFELGTGVVYHGLLGGMIRSGKSNLLHVLITQLALLYPPEELELYLVDLKVGVEFQNYLAFALPHARVIALEGEPEFALSVLRNLRTEIETRARLFPPLVSNLTEYRRETGRQLPRILLIMDEFQVLFRDDDRQGAEAGRILEDVARRGAAFGLHLLLCSQSPSGGLSLGRRVYDQMGLRIALQSRPADAMAILGEGNDAANTLERPGEAIYNADRGLKEHNIVIRTALLSSADRQRYLEVIRALGAGHNYPAPMTFSGRDPALLANNPEWCALRDEPNRPASTGPLKAWLGEPVEIAPPTAAMLERYGRSNLLIAGGNESEGYGLLLAALLSLTTQRVPSAARFVVLDFARPDAAVAGRFAQIAGSLPHDFAVAGSREAMAMLVALREELDQRLDDQAAAGDVFFVIAGLQRWREMRGDAYGPPSDAIKALLHLAEEGPEVGIHLLIWADSVSAIERVKRGSLALFDLRVALRLSESDSAALIGVPAAARLEDNRALYRHEEWETGRVERFKPYGLASEPYFRDGWSFEAT